MLGGEVFLSGEEVCELLKLSTRTLQEYRSNGTLAYYKIGGKILYKQSDIQAMLERHYNPISNEEVNQLVSQNRLRSVGQLVYLDQDPEQLIQRPLNSALK